MLDNLASSIIGTLIAEIITLPICTIKTVYQNNPEFNIKQTINHIYKNFGYKGFIQAYTPAIIAQVVSTSSKYSFYELIKNYRKSSKDDLFSNSLNGLAGGILGSFFSHPIDVWKNYLQRNDKFIYTNYRLYYQGYSASIYKNAVLYSCLFPIYDFYRTKFNSLYISSICTTLTVSFIIQPFDYYKTVKIAGNSINFQSIFDSKKIKQFTRGYTLMITRSIPHFTITMYFTELFKNKLK